jgi:gluconolactonase
VNKDIVASGLYVPEGPVVLPDGRIAFVEQVKGRVSVYDGSGVSVLAETRGAPNGLTVGADGNLYAAQNSGIVGAWRSPEPTAAGIQRITLAGEVSTVLTEVGGVTCVAPNDLAFGPDGRLWFTDPAHGFDPVDRGPGRVFATDGHEDELVMEVGATYPNGIGFTVDGRCLWVESYDRHLCVRSEDGERTVLGQLPEGHFPDGYAVAQDGRIFIATVTSHAVTVVGPDGQVLDVLQLDEDATVTNLCFEGNVLWVTDFGPDFAGRPEGGRLWRIETDAVGQPLNAGAISNGRTDPATA